MSAARIFDSVTSAMFMDALVAVYRHSSNCKPGLYEVVICIDTQWLPNRRHSVAVCDDFGNLVRVAQ